MSKIFSLLNTSRALWLSCVVVVGILAPFPANAFINAIELVIETGSDDLRGGNDNVNAIVLLSNRERLRFDNINNGERWDNGSNHTIKLNLSRTTDTNITNRDDIVGLLLETTFGGGVDSDNWQMKRLEIYPYDHTVIDTAATTSRLEPYFERELSGGRPLWHFRGNSQLYRANWSNLGFSHLKLQIRVGDDDLRQDNHLGARVVFRGGQQYFPDLNNNKNIRSSTDQGWVNDSYHTIWLPLDRVTLVGDVLGVVLDTSARGGFDGDNFNLNYLHIGLAALLVSALDVCYEGMGTPLKRFTGNDWSFEAICS